MTDKYVERRFDIATVEAIDREILETLPYEYPGKETVVEYSTDEFTAVCPWTGLPDFGRLVIRYLPDRLLVELKSLKYYLLSYRNVGIIQEHATNRVLEDLVAACQPVWMEVTGDFAARGGIGTKVTARYESDAARSGRVNVTE